MWRELWSTFTRRAEASPVLFACVSQGAKTTAADTLVQKAVEGREALDLERTAAFTVFGTLWMGGAQYYVYVRLFDHLLPARTAATAAAKVCLDQFVWVPFFFFPVFYVIDSKVRGEGGTGVGALLTAASERYRAAVARLDALAAAAPAAWVRSRPYGAWCAHLPQALAIDCEMCVTEDPATGALDGKALVRISIVDASRLDACAAAAAAGAHDDVVLDSLVKPSLPIKDAVERVHGIKASDLDGVAFTLAHAQAALAQLCSDRTVLIGHAVANDLEALRFRHGCIVDTSVAYGVVGAAAGVAPSLRDVAAAVLPPAQDAVNKSATHDSRVDARTAALCAYHLIGGTETLPKAVARRKHAREERSLFAHRIPAGVDDATLKAAVERTTGVALAADATIARGDAYGKCALVFKSPLHAQLAFDTLAGPAEEDTSGRPQKKIYLDDGGGSGKRPYCKVRPF